MTKKVVYIAIFVLLLGAVLASILSYGKDKDAAGSTVEGRLRVAATIFPIYDIARVIGGPDIDVRLIVPPGASEHTFDLTPNEVTRLSGTALVFEVGVIDGWTRRISESFPDTQIISIRDGIMLREGEAHDADAVIDGEIFDPHYWLVATNAEKIALTISNALQKADPAHAEGYHARYEAYRKELTLLDADIRKELAISPMPPIIVFHDAWGYFADAYGLRIAAVFEPSGGKSPTPGNLRAITDAVRTHAARAIFVEPQLPSDAVSALASDLDVKVRMLDPVGGIDGRDTYIALMRYNARTIRETLLQRD